MTFCLSAGCATVYNPATEREETVLDPAIESALGSVAKAQMGLASLKVGRVTGEQMARVQAIGARIARSSDPLAFPVQFGVIQDKTLNAFTLPGGTIYVHTGILDKASDDELAAVIAHEMGHVAARHVAKHLQADLGFTVLVNIAAAAGVGPESARLADSLYGLFSRGFSRRDELEADRLAVRYSSRAGVDPEGLVSFFEKIQREEQERPMGRVPVWQSTHPLTGDRIKQAKEEIEKLKGRRFCPVCGREYPGQVRFCERDGTPLKEKRGVR
ncbi:MAG: M48 family metalloprotease [Candidatus Omnitrophica bacterium]|nr:M48 family metalloprotease [Candidatus Omnitrophota bacterium]